LGLGGGDIDQDVGLEVVEERLPQLKDQTGGQLAHSVPEAGLESIL
jgi:hypothetical protein